MGAALPLACATALLLLLYLFRCRWRYAAGAAQHRCGYATQYWSKDPICNLDFQLSIHSDIHAIHRYHCASGHTFQLASLFGNPAIHTVAPENLQAVNGTGKSWGIEPVRIPPMEYFCGRGFLTIDGAAWQHSRKLLKPIFARSNLVNPRILSDGVSRFLSGLPGDGETVDLQPGLFIIFLNTSLSFLLGINPAQETQKAPLTSRQFIEAFHAGIFGMGMRVMLGRLGFLAPKAKYFENTKKVHDYIDFFVNEVIEEGRQIEGGQHQQSMIKGLVAQTDDRYYIRNQILQGMMASQETTAVLLGNAMFLLARHEQVWQQLRKEVLQYSGELVDFETLMQHCQIIRHILFETLRLFPIFPLLGRIALNDTVLPVGGGPSQNDPIYVEKGTECIASSFALHREPGVFGDDVESFRPARWQVIAPKPWEFVPFGGGQRSCLGKDKVLFEAAYVLARFAQSFERLESRDSAPWKGEVKLTCKNPNGCKVAFYESA